MEDMFNITDERMITDCELLKPRILKFKEDCYSCKLLPNTKILYNNILINCTTIKVQGDIMYIYDYDSYPSEFKVKKDTILKFTKVDENLYLLSTDLSMNENNNTDYPKFYINIEPYVNKDGVVNYISDVSVIVNKNFRKINISLEFMFDNINSALDSTRNVIDKIINLEYKLYDILSEKYKYIIYNYIYMYELIKIDSDGIIIKHKDDIPIKLNYYSLLYNDFKLVNSDVFIYKDNLYYKLNRLAVPNLCIKNLKSLIKYIYEYNNGIETYIKLCESLKSKIIYTFNKFNINYIVDKEFTIVDLDSENNMSAKLNINEMECVDYNNNKNEEEI